MTKYFLKTILCLMILFVVCKTSVAADTGVDGFNIQLFQPLSDESKTFSQPGSLILKHLKPRIAFMSNYAQTLLTARNPVNNQIDNIVDTFAVSDFLLGLGLFDFVDIGLVLPVFNYEDGTNFVTGNSFNEVTIGVAGDLRADLKFRLLKDKEKRPGIAFLSSVYFPTGDTNKFTGSEGVGYHGRLIIDKKFKYYYLTANLGYRYTRSKSVININYNDQITYGAGVNVPLPVFDKTISLITEIYGSVIFNDFNQMTSPLEILGGLQKKWKQGFDIKVGGGVGLTDAYGAPSYRLIAGIGYNFGQRTKKSKATQQENIIFNEVLLFVFDSFKIKGEYFAVLDNIAASLLNNKDAKINISGHSDNVGLEKYNLILSRKRAEEVKKYFLNKGVNSLQISTLYFGETKPKSSNKTKQGRALNRRVEINSK